MNNKLATTIADTIMRGFARHMTLFTEITRSAQQRFQLCQWSEVHKAASARTSFYDERVDETFKALKVDFKIDSLDSALWRKIKAIYTEQLTQQTQPELAETFFNSVFCRLFERKYYHNDYIFFNSTISHLNEKQIPCIYTSHQPKKLGLKQTIVTIINNHNTDMHFEDLERDIDTLIKAFRRQAQNTRVRVDDLQFDILNFTFYRNKGAYIIGRVLTSSSETPFIISVLNTEQGALYIDALLTDSESMAIVFGFARAYFFVDCPYPFALVEFLQGLMPHKTKADLYSAIGFHKQGKTQFYRDFIEHLENTDDKFQLAAGIKGMVMSVFTLPSYPYVFKIIKDKFSPSKNMTKADVKRKYLLVKQHDRVGRMADTMEYSEVAFPKSRFNDELLEELEKVASSILRYEKEGDEELIIINHLYIERRMIPLNLYLLDAIKNNEQEKINEAMLGYGQAIKQLISADIFPGDMLLKNFGMTRHNRVIFYDYDEISYMNEVNFRVKPKPTTADQLYAAEPWYSVLPGDVFPEEIATFALANPAYLKAFKKNHQNLLTAEYWQQCQRNVANGVYKDVFPYPDIYRLYPHRENK